MILKQMLTKNVHNKKRKCSNSGSNIQKRNRREPQLNYYHKLKAVEVSPGNYHYFGGTYNSRFEERLEIDWMNKYRLGSKWRKRHLRGQKLGTWVKLPIGRSIAGKL